MHSDRHIYILLMATVLLYYHGFTQPVSFQNYTSENGVSQNSGYAIAQTGEGFMWLGTQNGLDRFDSQNFKAYKHDIHNPFSLVSDFITALCVDGTGNLWVGTRKGVNIYNRNTGVFQMPSDYFKRNLLFDSADVKRIKYMAKSNTVWVATKDDGIYMFDMAGRRVKHYFDAAANRTLVRDIMCDDKGTIWLNTEKDIFRFNGNGFSKVVITKDTAAGKAILQEMLFYAGRLWIGSLNNGLFILDGKGNAGGYQLHELNAPGTKNVWGKEITRLDKDNKGKIWMGTAGNGLFVFDSSLKNIIHCSHDPSDIYSLKTNYILSSFEDRQGIMWVGTSGGGFAKYDPKKLAFTKADFFDEKTNTTSNMVMTLYNDANNYYIGTLAGGFVKTDTLFNNPVFFKNDPANKHSLLHNTVYGIAKDTTGIFWLATKAGLCSYNPRLPAEEAFTSYEPGNDGAQKYFYSIIKLQHQNALLVCGYNGVFEFDLTKHAWAPLNDVNNFTQKHILNVRYIAELPGNILLLCTEGYNMVKYDYGKGVFTLFEPLIKKSSIARHVLHKDGFLWIATDNGLLQVNASSYAIINDFNSTNILNDNVVYAVLPGKANTIWFSTNTGLARLNTGSKECKYFDESYGLQSMEFNTASCFKTPGGRLCFGGINGVNIFNPAAITDRGFIAPTVITGISVMNETYMPDSNVSVISTIVLPYNKNFVNIGFAETNFSHSEKNTFAYRLSGVDNNWVYAGNQRNAAYTQLKPADYVFYVKSANSDGEWNNDIKKLHIIITPPWWLTNWVKILGVLLLAATLYFIYAVRVRKIKKDEAFKSKLLEYELKAWHAQMNPHFIFNCLASIKQMIVDDEKAGATRYMNKFSKLIRATLEQSRQAFITIHDNNQYLANYIEMEQLRFGSAFTYKFEIDDDIDAEECKIPPMMMQPLVENAIWHGIMPSKTAGEIIISFKREGDDLICSVDDNGVGIGKKVSSKVEHQSYGIENIHQRLALLAEMYGINCSLQIVNKRELYFAESGTLAILTIKQFNNYVENR